MKVGKITQLTDRVGIAICSNCEHNETCLKTVSDLWAKGCKKYKEKKCRIQDQ